MIISKIIKALYTIRMSLEISETWITLRHDLFQCYGGWTRTTDHKVMSLVSYHLLHAVILKNLNRDY